MKVIWANNKVIKLNISEWNLTKLIHAQWQLKLPLTGNELKEDSPINDDEEIDCYQHRLNKKL